MADAAALLSAGVERAALILLVARQRAMADDKPGLVDDGPRS